MKEKTFQINLQKLKELLTFLPSLTDCGVSDKTSTWFYSSAIKKWDLKSAVANYQVQRKKNTFLLTTSGPNMRFRALNGLMMRFCSPTFIWWGIMPHNVGLYHPVYARYHLFWNSFILPSYAFWWHGRESGTCQQEFSLLMILQGKKLFVDLVLAHLPFLWGRIGPLKSKCLLVFVSNVDLRNIHTFNHTNSRASSSFPCGELRYWRRGGIAGWAITKMLAWPRTLQVATKKLPLAQFFYMNLINYHGDVPGRVSRNLVHRNSFFPQIIKILGKHGRHPLSWINEGLKTK